MRPYLTAAILLLSIACLAQTGSLLQGITTSQTSYQIGEEIEFTYGIKNTGDKAVVFNFPSSQQFDIWVTRAGSEVFRHSRGMMYAQMMTSFTLQPGQTKTFTAKWNQKDYKGKQVGPGTYTVHAKLTARNAPPTAKGSVEIGGGKLVVIPVTVKEAIERVGDLAGKRVSIAGTYLGWKPDPDDPNCKGGPPVTRSDWVIGDNTGCMYVTGKSDLSPTNDVGKKITVIGTLERSSTGQIYLKLVTAT